MSDKHKIGPDGLREDGVSSYPADDRDLRTYEDGKAALARFSAPTLVHATNPNERLYVAAFDGTGNDGNQDPEHATNVHKIRHQVEALKEQGNHQIKVGYVEGPGTQANALARTWDGARGHTYDERLEEMYKKFIDQAWKWRRAEPNVQINIAGIGFSRGAEQAAGFARLVHDRGIQDPMGAIYAYDSQRQITSVQYTRPPLVQPGQVAQVVGLFDPVGTGEPVNEHDRRLPPSVISGIQLIAEAERRGLFKATHIIDPGMTPDGRFLGMVVGGAHSDLGGGYHRDGLAIRSGNLMVDYLNALSDRPFLTKSHEPDDPRLNVVHRSEEGMVLYRVWPKVDRLKSEGYVDELTPKAAPDRFNSEPRDAALNAKFERRAVAIGPTPAQNTATVDGARTPGQAQPKTELEILVERVNHAARNRDDAALGAVAQDFRQTSYGREWVQQQQDYSQAQRAQEQEYAQQLQAQEAMRAQQQEVGRFQSHGRSR